MSIEFIKMHGLGNDFVFINKADLAHRPLNIKKITDRKIGIGCDQLILYHRHNPGYYEIEIYNPDNSKAGMCGNAMRCIGLLAHEQYNETNIEVKVAERNILVQKNSSENIQVNMGKAEFNKSWMPRIADLSKIFADYPLNLKEIICVDMGNPHIVIFYRNLGTQEKSLLGQYLQNCQFFPDSVNVNFARIEGDKIHLRVFERGVGFTLACGSGACATFAAARHLKFVENQAQINFELGSLFMSYENENIILSGPANKIATGVYCEQ